MHKGTKMTGLKDQRIQFFSFQQPKCVIPVPQLREESMQLDLSSWIPHLQPSASVWDYTFEALCVSDPESFAPLFLLLCASMPAYLCAFR